MAGNNGPQDIPPAGGGGITPPAGDIGGTTVAPVVVGLQGEPVSAAVPGAGNVLQFVAGAWTPEPPSGGGVSSVNAGDGTLVFSPTTGAVLGVRAALTGDVTCSAGSNATVLTNSSNVQAVVGAIVAATAEVILAIAGNQTVSFTAAANTIYPCTGALTATLPVNPTVGTRIGFFRAASVQVTINAGAGGNINGTSTCSLINSSLNLDPYVELIAISATTWIIRTAVGTDAALGFRITGSMATNNIQNTGGWVGHVLTRSTAYTTLATDDWIEYTAGTVTCTLGTSGFIAGMRTMVSNTGSGTITLAAASGTIDTTTLPPNSAVLLVFDGTNWKTVGSNGLVSGGTFPLSTPVAGVLGSTFTVTTTLTTFLTTASLAVGTWRVTFDAVALATTGTPIVGVLAALGTAAGSISGPVASQTLVAVGNPVPLPLSFLVTVTSAGTIVFQAQGGATGGEILASQTTPAVGACTGYTAERVA